MGRKKIYCECDGGTKLRRKCWTHNEPAQVAQKNYLSHPDVKQKRAEQKRQQRHQKKMEEMAALDRLLDEAIAIIEA